MTASNSKQSFFFYDLETSGVNPRSSRIMQFAGRRTDENLDPIGDPVNVLIKISDDVLPDPEACLVTGITPQMTLADGVTEVEFLKQFDSEINLPGTTFVGFNNVRFDDEFMRYLLYRNYRDPYEWQWKDGRGRWDLLDLTRMCRALRPGGIKWPFGSDGKPTNRLELIASLNNLEHTNAHDALSDVDATIGVAKLIRDKQPKLFNYLLESRNKRAVQALISGSQPVVYSSGKYSSDNDKTTVVLSLGPHPESQGELVYDLRFDPKKFIDLSPEELAKLWQYDPEAKKTHLPIKALKPNRCPAIAPMGVLDKESRKRLNIDLKEVEQNKKTLAQSEDFYNKITKALDILNRKRSEQTELIQDQLTAEEKLYDGFIPDADKRLFPQMHEASPDSIMEFTDRFKDERLRQMLLPYKARNYKKHLSEDESIKWEKYRYDKLLSGGEKSRFAMFGSKLEEIMNRPKVTSEQQYVLEELHLYALSIRPVD